MTRRRAPRLIELLWATAVGDPSVRRVTAECCDELTVFVFMGASIFDESDPDALLAGPFGQAVVDDHRARCGACRAWERAS